jgi:uncharacterized circularly permuted ATP-grasp superfamily protein
MENKKFDHLLSDARRQLDELNKLVTDTIKTEGIMLDTVLPPPLIITNTRYVLAQNPVCL